MSSNDRQTKGRIVAIARLAKFINKYIPDIDWTITAQACGIIDILNNPSHDRVRRAQYFGDVDYPSAVSSLINDVFNTEEQAGIHLVNEIVDCLDNSASPEVKTELDQILMIFGGKEPNSNYLVLSHPRIIIEKYLDVTDFPDDFYKTLIEEINNLFTNGFCLSLSVLIRKLLENLLIDILRKRYGNSDLSLYYDTSKRRFLDFSILIKNLEFKQADFQHITSNLDNKFISEINSYRESGNSGAHSIDANIRVEYYKERKDTLNYLVKFLFRLLKNIPG
jgi:hypothetical protein